MKDSHWRTDVTVDHRYADAIRHVLSEMERPTAPTLASAYEWEIFLASEHLRKAVNLAREGDEK